ncbi:DUF58 domain-containing protein [Novosphingobium sp. Gsoil 351]|uniref:DUF58 domain-containing protein n=1 Tax=Novosphingobium sp. Gsoil 351 TaxID=2675225 RepID=UPI0012B44B51|nr:DUF58 domain-containing protein [Novosphingobium sp. Gsoil 351]QGN54779.1 DUF58 domain-containing protein [Novosphingobium sp. Gsoil 351]
MTFYPTARTTLLLVALAPLALLLAAVAEPLWVLAPLVGLVIVALVVADAALAGRAADVRLIAPGDAEIGESLALTVLADFAGRRGTGSPEAALAVDPRLAAGGRTAFPLAYDPASASWSGTAELLPNRRGSAAIAALWLRWPGPLGLAWRQRVETFDRIVRIRPNLAPARSPALQMLLRDAQFGLVARRIRGEGSQFEALAEYEPGMDRRRIDWKSSARHVRLLAKEMEAERNLPIVFAFDCGQAMCEPVEGLPRIDRAVSAALTTAFVALKAGDRVALFGFAARVLVATPFIVDTRQFRRLHAAAAELDYRPEEANFTLALSTLAARLQRRSLVVLFAEFTDPTGAELMIESVARLVTRHRVLFVVLHDEELEAMTAREPASVQAIGVAVAADALARQRMLVLARLRRLGVDIVEAPWREVGTRLLDAYLTLKRGGGIG